MNTNIEYDTYSHFNYLNVYRFGSKVYGSNTATSDDDLIVVVKDYVPSDDINVHHYTIEQFQTLLNLCDIQILECVFLDDKYKLKESVVFTPNIDKGKLRKSISTIVSTSWVKGKKKLIVTGDYDKWLAIKSVFHSLRILDFGIQIAQHGKIINYGSMNYVLTDLIKMSEEFDRTDLWDVIYTKYNPIYLSKSSTFKSLCPKILIDSNKVKNELIDIFVENNAYSKEVVDNKLISKIIEYFNKQ